MVRVDLQHRSTVHQRAVRRIMFARIVWVHRVRRVRGDHRGLPEDVKRLARTLRERGEHAFKQRPARTSHGGRADLLMIKGSQHEHMLRLLFHSTHKRAYRRPQARHIVQPPSRQHVPNDLRLLCISTNELVGHDFIHRYPSGPRHDVHDR